MENLKICNHCLLAIESREGAQSVEEIPVCDDDTEAWCDWCGQTAEEGGFDVLIELLPEV